MPGKSTDGPVSRLLNRRISSRISGFIVGRGLPVTPNMMSLLTFTVGLAAVVLALYGHLVLAGLAAQASSILDGVDGEIARLTGRASRRGAFLDTMLDRYTDMLLIGATMWSAMRISGVTVEAAVLAGLLALTGDLLVSYLHARGVLDLGVHPSQVGPLDSIASRDVRILLLSLFLVASRPYWALIAVGVLAHSYVIVKTVYLLEYHAD